MPDGVVRIVAVREACKADIEQQCPNARPGAGRILVCVKKHFATLACKDAIGHAAELKVGSY
jgi:cysteine rich repeat protein